MAKTGADKGVFEGLGRASGQYGRTGTRANALTGFGQAGIERGSAGVGQTGRVA